MMGSKAFVMLMWICLAAMGEGRVVQDAGNPGLELTIVHVNDIHAHFEEMNEYGSRCNDEASNENKCYGGQARLLTKANELLSLDREHSLFLNAGDYYTGTAMFTEFGYPVIVDFSNMMNYDAMSIGNHDFDKEISGIEPFLQQANYTFLAANLNRSSVPELKGCKNSLIKTIGGQKVGIVGYITSATPQMSNSDLTSLEFLPEVAAVQREARMLKQNHGVDIIIALGHSGYDVDQELARNVPELDVVVGGHSHTFLWTGDDLPSGEKPEGPYPTYVTQKSGKVVPVVQAYCYSKYIGYFKLKFDAQGELMQPVDGTGVTEAKPYLIDRSIEPNQDVLDKIAEYRKNMTKFNEKLGESEVLLYQRDGQEGNLGNLISEAMLDAYDDADLALMNDGGIRSNIAKGEVILEDITTVLPFENTVDSGKVRGSDLRKIMEETYSTLGDKTAAKGASTPNTFFQMAGMKVKVVVTEGNSMNRIKKFEVKCGSGFCDLDDNKDYKVVVPSFIANGGDIVKTSFKSVLKDHVKGSVDVDVMKDYVKRIKTIKTKIDGRIDISYQQTSGAVASLTSINSLLGIVAVIITSLVSTTAFSP